jgi:hypothetical protein
MARRIQRIAQPSAASGQLPPGERADAGGPCPPGHPIGVAAGQYTNHVYVTGTRRGIVVITGATNKVAGSAGSGERGAGDLNTKIIYTDGYRSRT